MRMTGSVSRLPFAHAGRGASSYGVAAGNLHPEFLDERLGEAELHRVVIVRGRCYIRRELVLAHTGRVGTEDAARLRCPVGSGVYRLE
jgi:hypothetical protein